MRVPSELIRLHSESIAPPALAWLGRRAATIDDNRFLQPST